MNVFSSDWFSRFFFIQVLFLQICIYSTRFSPDFCSPHFFSPNSFLQIIFSSYFIFFLSHFQIAFMLAKTMTVGDPAVSLGIFACGICPGGGASNMFCYLVDGDVSLSVTMTAISSIGALGNWWDWEDGWMRRGWMDTWMVCWMGKPACGRGVTPC